MKSINILHNANQYVGHPQDIDESNSITMQRQAFVDGAQWAIKETVKWLQHRMYEHHEYDEYDEVTQTFVTDNSANTVQEFLNALVDHFE